MIFVEAFFFFLFNLLRWFFLHFEVMQDFTVAAARGGLA